MNERQRMQYLETMGIDCFVPRFVLPEAKSSSLCELPVANDPVRPLSIAANGTVQAPSSHPEISESTSNVNSSGLAQIEGAKRISIDDIIDGKKTELALEKVASKEALAHSLSEATVQSLVESVTDVPKEAVQFSLSLWHIDKIQIIDSRKPGDALPTDALLSNILLAIGGLSLQLPRVERIDWPMVETASDKSWQAAREMVQGFLEGRLLAKPASHILLFGQDACTAVIGQDVDFIQQQYQTLPVDAFDASAIVLPSLADILRAPSFKSDVWRALSVLVDRA
ncbi:MAG: hypothetical protein K6L80_09130 [Agarilytica sp.]